VSDDDVNGGQPFDPRLDRYRPLTRALDVAHIGCVSMAVLAVLLPDPIGRWLGVAAVGLLVVVPMMRVLWLVNRWMRRGDRRYALVGVGVLAVTCVGVALAALGL
jgi:hypothetical protein